MKVDLPDIPEAECTPLVVRLLEIIHQLQERIQHLEQEVARLQAVPPRPKIAPSALERPAAPTGSASPGKRPGSQKRPKTAQLTIHREVVVGLETVPPGAAFKGYEDFVVQELVLRPEVTCYRRERWRTPEGRTLVAPLPPEVVAGRHFGPDLQCYLLHQYHHQHVTQPLLREELGQLGIAISAGEVNRILTEGHDRFHQEKEGLLPAGLQASCYVQVDDTTARHQGHNGFCLHIGNDLFAYFASTDHKSRLNFLEVLRRPHTDYVINELARAYWKSQRLAPAVAQAVAGGPCHFADAAAWQAHLEGLGVTGERYTRITTEGALLGSLVEHGVSPGLVTLSDGAGQFDVLVHALCWVHQERLLARMVPFNERHREALAGVRQRIWELYARLKAYQRAPDPAQKPALEAQFDSLCAGRAAYPAINQVLKDMQRHKAELLRVLERPEVPLHNNVSESHLREYVTKRKISGSTRSELGRRCRDTFASLKKTCRALGVNFWQYLQDRLRGRDGIPWLPELVRQRAAGLRATQAGAAPA